MIVGRHRRWLLKCKRYRSMNRKLPIFLREKETKFLEESAWKFINRTENKTTTKSKKMKKNKKKISPKEAQLPETSLLEAETENHENLEKVPETLNVIEKDKSNLAPPLPSHSFPVYPFYETNDLIKIAQSFTGFKYLSNKKQVEARCAFGKILMR